MPKHLTADLACSICRAELGDVDARVCRGCEYRLAYVLQQLVAEIPLLRAQLAPYRSPSTGTRHGGAAHPPLPVDARVLDLLASHWLPDPDGQDSGGVPIGPLMVGWCSLLAASYPAITRAAGTVYITPGCEPVPRVAGGIPGWAAWLRGYIGYATTWDRAPELWEAFEDALVRVRAVTGTQPRTRRRHAPCPACSAFGMASTDGRWHVQCQVCGHQMAPDAYAEHAAEVLPGLTALAVHIAAGAARDDAPDAA